MTIKRKLFYAERLLFLNGDRSRNPISITFPISIKGNIPHSRVRLALDKLQKRHPALRARIEGCYLVYEDTDFRPIPLRIVYRVSENTWETEKEKFVPEPYNYEEGPLLRVLWVKSNEVSEFVFTALHAIMDWKSCVILMKEFYILLNAPDKEVVPYLPIQSMKDLLPDVSLTWKEKLMGNVWTEILRWKLIFTTWNKKVPPPQFYSLIFFLNEEMTLALNKAAEKNKVSVGNISCILAAKLFKAHFHPGKPECTFFMPLDIRRYASSVKRDMFFGFAPMIRPKIQLSDDEDVWEQARRFEKEVIRLALTMQKTHSQSIRHSIKRGLLVGEYYHRIIKLILKRNYVIDEKQDFIFASLGKQQLRLKNPEFEIQHILPSEIRFPWHNPTYLGIMEFFNNTIEFAFCSNENLIPKEVLKVIRSEFEQAVKDLIKDEMTKTDN